MTTLRIILGDQLSTTISSLHDIDKHNDLILMCEVNEEAQYVKHHKKKIAFIFSAMRHFAEGLKKKKYNLLYTKLTDKENTGSFKGEVKKTIRQHHINHIIITHPGEHRVLEDIQSWETDLNVSLEIREDNRFICSTDEFTKWVKNRKQPRMEHFYRHMRKQKKVLIDDDKPIGGKWNYDTDNRKPPKSNLTIPKPCSQKPDQITKEVISLVNEKFKDHLGELDGFDLAITRDQALKALENFLSKRMPSFGDYQDAMLEGEPWMYHSHISTYLNAGLLLPMECVKAAEDAYLNGSAPMNAAEGFIRQILGWREYIRGIYWLKMPGYADMNFFNATRPLPSFYWTAKTDMNCLKQSISETKKNAYAHHIQRLMILGNFALLTGIDPKQVSEWFLIVYTDAYEWVELPNVYGMALFADGGYLASKPYAAGGSYINKMSNYCKNCEYNVKKKTGADACPFNYLYWNFLAKNKKKLEKNHRLAMMYSTYERMDEKTKKQIKNDSLQFLENLT